jgi:hypothetical protein
LTIGIKKNEKPNAAEESEAAVRRYVGEVWLEET